jgi:hypothetical protein
MRSQSPEACLLMRASQHQWECTESGTPEEVLQALQREHISRALLVDCRRRQPLAVLRPAELTGEPADAGLRRGMETFVVPGVAPRPQRAWNALARGDDRLNAVIVIDTGLRDH